MIRSGNEDAFAVLHGVDSRQDELIEYALILLCDGMGGYEAGEVAAALAIDEMKRFFLQQPMFAGLTGKDAPAGPLDIEAAKRVFDAGLRHANREVFTASRTPGRGKRGMGCTAEAVYVDGYFAGKVDEFDGKLQRLHVEPGEHEIVVYLDGYRSLRQRLYLSPNSTRTIDGRLEPLREGDVQEPPPQPTEDEMDLDREIEYAFDTEEPMVGRPPAGDVE